MRLNDRYYELEDGDGVSTLSFLHMLVVGHLFSGADASIRWKKDRWITGLNILGFFILRRILTGRDQLQIHQ